MKDWTWDCPGCGKTVNDDDLVPAVIDGCLCVTCYDYYCPHCETLVTGESMVDRAPPYDKETLERTSELDKMADVVLSLSQKLPTSEEAQEEVDKLLRDAREKRGRVRKVVAPPPEKDFSSDS